jgi:hypothetical protein
MSRGKVTRLMVIQFSAFSLVVGLPPPAMGESWGALRGRLFGRSDLIATSPLVVTSSLGGGVGDHGVLWKACPLVRDGGAARDSQDAWPRLLAASCTCPSVGLEKARHSTPCPACIINRPARVVSSRSHCPPGRSPHPQWQVVRKLGLQQWPHEYHRAVPPGPQSN